MFLSVAVFGSAETISEDTTWSLADSPFTKDMVRVANGAALTIEPGVEVRFGDRGGIIVNNGGTLLSEGSVADPILMTTDSDTPTTESWVGVIVAEGGAMTMRHSIVEYGGQAEGNTFYTRALLAIHSSDVLVQDSIFRLCSQDGILIDQQNNQGQAPEPVLQNIEVSDCPGYGIHVQSQDKPSRPVFDGINIHDCGNTAIQLHGFDNLPEIKSATIMNTAYDGVDVAGANNETRDYTITGAVKWRLKYIRTPNNITARIEKGAHIEMLNDLPGYGWRKAWITAETGGALIVEGTEEEPVVITTAREPKTSNHFAQISIQTGSTARFNHCRLEYHEGILASTADVEFRNTVVDHVNGTGLHLYNSPSAPWGRPLVLDTTISNCSSWPIQCSSTLGQFPILESIILENNSKDVVYIGGGTSGDYTPDGVQIYIGNPGYPYYGASPVMYNDYEVTIAPGTVFQLSHRFNLRRGTFRAIGTEDNPIQVIPQNEEVGLTNPIVLEYDGKAELEHCIVWGGCEVDGNSHPDTWLTARNCSFINGPAGEYYGLSIQGGNAIIQNCKISDNVAGGVSVQQANEPRVMLLEGCEISGNGGNGAFGNAGLQLIDCDIFGNGTNGFEGYWYEDSKAWNMPRLEGCRITGNGELGVKNSTTYKPAAFPARNCWWGDATGPYHATLNPNGLGAEVGNNVSFVPWAINEEATAVTETTPAILEQRIDGSTDGTDYYALTLAEGDVENLIIEMTPTSQGGNWRLLERDGKMPTLSLFDREGRFRGITSEILIPSPRAGVYYIAVDYSDAAGGTGTYRLQCRNIARYLTGVSTHEAGNAGVFTQELQGCGFEAGMTVTMKTGATTLGPFTPTSYSATNLVVPMDLTGAATGPYAVTVHWDGGGEASLIDSFSIIPGTGEEFWAGFTGTNGGTTSTGSFRPGRTQVYPVYWGNSGDADAAPRILALTTDQPLDLRMTLDDEAGTENVQFLAIGPAEDVSKIPPGYMKQVDFYFLMAQGGLSFALSLEGKEADDTPIDWDSQKDSLRPGNIDVGTWEANWASVKQALGATTAEHMAMLVRNAQRISDRGSASPDPAYSVSHLVDLEIQSVLNQPVASISGKLYLLPWGRPQPAAAVKLYDLANSNAEPRIVRSNAAGEYCFNNVPNGMYDIYVDTYFLETLMTVSVSNQQDMPDFDLFIYDEDPRPAGPDNVLVGRYPSITAGPTGNAYLTWENSGELYSLAYSNSGWEGSTRIADATGANPDVVFDANLFGASQPGLLAVWEQMSEEGATTLVWSAGKWSSSVFQWTIPQALTSDTNDDLLPQIMRASDGTWLVMWLQRAPGTTFDDADIYYAAIDPASAGDWYVPPVAKVNKQVCDSLNFGTSVPIPGKLQEVFGKAYKAQVGFELCEGDKTCASYSKSGAATIDIELGDSLTGKGSGQISASYRLACKPCRYMPWSMNMTAAGGLEADFARPLPIIIGGIPVGTAKFSLPVALQMKGTLFWNRDFTGLPDSGFIGMDCIAGGRVVIEDHLGVGKGQGDLNITGSYQWNPTEGFKVDGACVTLSGEAAVFGGFAKRKVQKQWGDACGKSTLEFGEKRRTTDKSIYYANKYLQDGIVVSESIELLASPATGTGGVYEGTPVLADIANDLYDDGAPAYVRDASGVVTMVWTKDVGDYANGLGNQVVFATDDGTGWTAPQPIETARHFNRDVALVQLADGSLLAIWSQADATGLTSSSPIATVDAAAQTSKIVSARFTDGTWSAPSAIGTVTGRNDQVCVARIGSRVYTAWVQTVSETDARIVAAIYNGTWTAPLTVSNSAWCDSPDMTVVGTSALLVWSEDEDGDLDTAADTRLRYASATSAYWSAPAFIPASVTSEVYAVAKQNNSLKREDLILVQKALPRPDDSCCGTTCKPTYKKPRPKVPPPPRRQENRTDMAQVRSSDPNEKHGPKGWGVTGIVQNETEFVYTILFENKPDATAPAQEVFITDDLPEELDWSTFEVRSVGWGNVIKSFASPKAIDEYISVADYRADVGGEWLVNVLGYTDQETGRVSFTFQTLDPILEELPLDPLAGFLPPNDDTHRGEGFITFALKLKPGLAEDLSVSIENKASIIFDLNEPIITNEAVHIIGDIPVLWESIRSRLMVTPEELSPPDVNGDGVIDVSDMIAK